MGRLLLWAALLAAMVGTASAEYQLALACGFGPILSGCVPGALDVYALAAFRARRDVPAVVIVLVLVNSVSHLVSAGALSVEVPLIVGVSAILPLVLWRVHALAEPKCVAERPAEAPESPAPVVEISRAEIEAPEAISAPPEPVSGLPEAPEPVLDEAPAQELDPLLNRAREIDESFRRDAGRPAPLRHLQRELRIGQARAQRIRAQLEERITS